MGEHSTYGGSIIENAVGNCPEVKVKLGGVDVRCLIDTGAEVSTITESFYKALSTKRCYTRGKIHL